MINESFYWKNELLKISGKIFKRTKSKRYWTSSQEGTFEKEIMFGFYIIRKLIESKKLSNSLVSTKLVGRKFISNGKNVTILNNHRIDELYKLTDGKKEKFDLIFLCNQIVHSYIFLPVFEDGIKPNNSILSGIWFCSNEKRNETLYELNIESIIILFQKISNDYPSRSSFHFDLVKRDYKVFNENVESEFPSI